VTVVEVLVVDVFVADDGEADIVMKSRVHHDAK